MNKITLNGIIKNISLSHNADSVQYDKANLITKREDGKEDVVIIKFKDALPHPIENEQVLFTGNLRTYTSKSDNGKNNVELYVYTQFAPVELVDEDGNELYLKSNNYVELSGNICKKGELRKTRTGLSVIDFILANNIDSYGNKIGSYIPCVAWKKDAEFIDALHIGDAIEIIGQLHSREYKKKINETDYENRIAWEVNIDEIVKE